MKRTLLIAVAALMLTPAVFAQSTTYKLDEKKILEQIKTSDEAIANEKRAGRGQTWLDRGDAMYNAGTAVSERLFGGMTLAILMAERGKDFQTSTREVGGKTFKVVSYPSVDVYLLNDVVQFWHERVTIYENALEKSFEAYKKAAELDPKLQTKAADGIKRIADVYKLRAFNEHSLEQVIKAAENFKKAYEVQLDPLVNMVDSSSMFNAGYLYIAKDDFQNAIENLSKARSVGYWNDGDVGYYLMYAYLRTDQEDKAKEVIVETARLFPNNNKVIEGLINYYSLTNDDFSEIKDIIVGALAKDPNNLVLLNGLGQIYLKQNEVDRVIEIYTRIVNIDPDNFAANYYLADAWIDKANVKIRDLESKYQGMSESAQKEALAGINELFKKSLPYLEKAYEVNPNERAVVSRLVQVYYRLGENDPAMDAMYEKFKKIDEGLE